MKQRLTGLDIRALVVTLLRKVKSLRVANIYDISNKLYLFKLSAKGKKEFLLIEAGIRMHTTEFVRNQSSIPSGFTMKLRKHLRTRRIENIRQVGIDRVVDITLGQDQGAFHILIEFYASGNLILTDHEYNIISLLRTHRYDEDTRCAVGEKYPFTYAANLSLDSIVKDKSGIEELIQQAEIKNEESNDQNNKKVKKKKKKRGEGGIKDILIKMVPYMTPTMAEHCLLQVSLDDSQDFDITNSEIVEKMIKAAAICKDMVQGIEDMKIIPGYIVYEEITESADDLLADQKKNDAKPSDSVSQEDAKKSDELQVKPLEEIKEEAKKEKEKTEKENEGEGEGDDDEPGVDPDQLFKGKRVKDFVCFYFEQMKTQKTLEFDWFDESVDLYFTQIDKQKEETKVNQKEAEIYKKMNRIKNDQLKRIEGLQKEQDTSLAKAKLLQNNISEVQAIIEILTALKQSGLQWKEIWRMIKEEKRTGNPLANLIEGLNLEKDSASLFFNTADMENKDSIDEFFSEMQEDIIVKIDLDLAVSAQANIQKYFEIKKKTQDKEERTKDKAHDAIKHAEDQARRALNKTRNEQKLKTEARKPFWFEKYDWFISSENYLIISGKNAQQNEEIVKTYLGKRDVYVHSEMAGSASCIIKNPTLEEVSPITLNESGTWAICHSKAWDMKIVTSAFWVWGDQVSKTPQSGEYLVTGSFMIRGKKNYVHPPRLELGCTVLFGLDDDSIGNHLNERRIRTDVGSTSLKNKNFELYRDQSSEPASQNKEKAKIEEIEPKEPAKVVEVTEEKEPEKPSETADETPQDNDNEQDQTDEEAEGEDDESEGEGELDVEEEGKDTHPEKQVNQDKSSKKEQDKKVNVGQLPRGKKRKLLKRNKKYADQDDEDRKFALEALGAKDMQVNEKKKDKQENEKYEYSKTDQSKSNNQKGQKQQKDQKDQKIQKDQKPQKDQKSQKDQKPQKDSKQSQNQSQKPKQNKQKNTKEEDKQEIAQIMKDENILFLGDKADISVLDKLTGNPKAGDTLLYAVPMCAPYSMINTHKFKAKILPGTLKRGRARKLCHEIFSTVAKGNEVEQALLRAIPDDQGLEVLPKGCQVLAAGLNKIKQNKKKNKKANKKKD